METWVVAPLAAVTVTVPVSGVDVPVPPPPGFVLLPLPPPHPTRVRASNTASARNAKTETVRFDLRVRPRTPIKKKPATNESESRASVPPDWAELLGGMLMVSEDEPLLVSEVGFRLHETPVKDVETAHERLMVPVKPFTALMVTFCVKVEAAVPRVTVRVPLAFAIWKSGGGLGAPGHWVTRFDTFRVPSPVTWS